MDDSERYSCSHFTTREKLLLTGKSAKAQTGRTDFVVKGGQSPVDFHLPRADVSAQPYITAGSQSYINCHRERKRMLWRALVTEEIENLALFVLSDMDVLSTEKVSARKSQRSVPDVPGS